MLEELLSGGLGLVGSLINNAAAAKRQRQMLRHLREVEAWQKHNLAIGINSIQAGKQAFEADPRRAKIRAAWEARLENPSALTDEAVSQTKATALSSNAANFAEGSRRMKANAQRAGIGSSGYVGVLDSAMFQGANRDAQNLAANIDLNAAKTRTKDRNEALAGYQDYTQSDLDRAYGFNKDLTNTLAGVSYGNSLAMTG